MVRLMALWFAAVAALLFVVVAREERLAARGRVPLGRLRRFWPHSERRRAPRYRVNWIVRYERLEPPPTNGSGRTRDVSQTGAGLTLSEKLPIGSLIRLEVTAPENGEPVELTAEVVWLKEVPFPENQPGVVRQFFIGIRFRGLESTVEQRILEALRGHPSF